eukprot:CAMPEP_0174245666 /NCGR_PEP_ID=MMETSP0417-20130205/40208_1 /TAXON_ID=242541 /ORGANISM="Mayorella sp, Strain BSH-02190019" /LENGTH=97 /DNA_ID=CAMNT_0015325475 /DNA_START=168 /DNA_END=458 /DNA_ORIENTATION=+
MSVYEQLSTDAKKPLDYLLKQFSGLKSSVVQAVIKSAVQLQPVNAAQVLARLLGLLGGGLCTAEELADIGGDLTNDTQRAAACQVLASMHRRSNGVS